MSLALLALFCCLLASDASRMPRRMAQETLAIQNARTCLGNAQIRLSTPASSDYTNLTSTVFDIRYGMRQPAFFVLPSSTAQVSTAVKCLRRANASFVVRSGACSLAGTSIMDKGVVLDLSLLTYMSIDKNASRAWVGAGQRSGQLYLSLLQAGNYTFPGPSGVMVGVSGYISGGGYGFASRQLGFGSDNVAAFTAVQVDREGTIVDNVIASSSNVTLRSLFQAVAGGGGNFVIVTKWKLKIAKANPSYFVLSRHCPASMANALTLMKAFFAWQPWEAGPNLTFMRLGFGQSELSLSLVYAGPAPNGLLNDTTALPNISGCWFGTNKEKSYVDAFGQELGHTNTTNWRQDNAAAIFRNRTKKYQTVGSVMLNNTALPNRQDVMEGLYRLVQSAPAGCKPFFYLLPMLKRSTRNGNSVNALQHGDILFKPVTNTDNATLTDACMNYTVATLDLIWPLSTKQQYYDYLGPKPSPSVLGNLTSEQLYYGRHAAAMVAVKNRWDPDNVLRAFGSSQESWPWTP